MVFKWFSLLITHPKYIKSKDGVLMEGNGELKFFRENKFPLKITVPDLDLPSLIIIAHYHCVAANGKDFKTSECSVLEMFWPNNYPKKNHEITAEVYLVSG